MKKYYICVDACRMKGKNNFQNDEKSTQYVVAEPFDGSADLYRMQGTP